MKNDEEKFEKKKMGKLTRLQICIEKENLRDDS